MPTNPLLSGFSYPPTAYSAAYGGKPTLPNPSFTATQALTGNLSNLSQIYNLAKGVNAASAAGAQNQLIANLPNYADMTRQSSQNILAQLGGEVAPDVWNQIAQRAAERGISSGAPISPNANAALLAALGKTSLDMQQLGEQNLTAAIGRTPRGPLFDPSTMLVTPEQQQQASLAQAIYAAAPDPEAAARAQRNLARAGVQAGLRTGGGGGGTSWANSFAPFTSFSSGTPMFQPEPMGVIVAGATGYTQPSSTYDPTKLSNYSNFNDYQNFGGTTPTTGPLPFSGGWGDDWSVPNSLVNTGAGAGAGGEWSMLNPNAAYEGQNPLDWGLYQ